MSRDHVALLEMHSSEDVEVYRVCELESVPTSSEVTLAVAVFDRRKRDVSIVPCGPWSGERAIASVRELFDASNVEPGRMPSPPYGGKRMLYLLAEAKAMLSNAAARSDSTS
jgi:hypothetical protein